MAIKEVKVVLSSSAIRSANAGKLENGDGCIYGGASSQELVITYNASTSHFKYTSSIHHGDHTDMHNFPRYRKTQIKIK
ncbi:hypothetical protein L1887_01784 [Cichorium endivia]|nr:hypothetical protein L1887_01784 [Cichorium endivia]